MLAHGRHVSKKKMKRKKKKKKGQRMAEAWRLRTAPSLPFQISMPKGPVSSCAQKTRIGKRDEVFHDS